MKFRSWSHASWVRNGKMIQKKLLAVRPEALTRKRKSRKKKKAIANPVTLYTNAISHSEYRDVLLNRKCLRHLMNRIQSKNHRIRTYEIDATSLSCLNDKIYILNNGYDGLALNYYS